MLQYPLQAFSEIVGIPKRPRQVVFGTDVIWPNCLLIRFDTSAFYEALTMR